MNSANNLTRLILLLLCSGLVAVTELRAQSESDVNVSQGGYGLVKTNMSMSYDHGWGDLQDGFAARVSYEFFRNKHFTVTANAQYTSSEIKFDSRSLSNGYIPEEIGLNGTHLFGQIGLNSTFKTKLFGKPFMGIAMLNSEWSEGGFARISGIAMGLVMLRANRNTQFGIGPLVMVNSCSKIPAFLVFMYRHKFNQKWLLNLYGGMFSVDFTLTRQDLLSVGADIDVKAFYFKPHSDSLPTRCRFTSTSFRPMIKYKRRLAPNLYFDIQGGVSLKMSCRVNGVTGSKEWIDCRQKAAPFVRTGVSYAL